MKTNSVILLVLWLAAWPFCCRGQGYISYDYLPESSLKDDLGNEYGSGSLMMVSGRYNLPLSVRHDDKGRLVAWSATVNAAYGVFHNKGQARELNPDNLLNAWNYNDQPRTFDALETPEKEHNATLILWQDLDRRSKNEQHPFSIRAGSQSEQTCPGSTMAASQFVQGY